MRRLIPLVIAVTFGAVLTYLFDPDRGRSRRAKLSDQMIARARDASESVKAQAEYQRGVVKGAVHEATAGLSDDRTYDDDTLLQKVRSEALGYWSNQDAIEIDITDGIVRINGSVDDLAEHDRLIELVRDVDGVGLIDDRVEVGSEHISQKS